MTMSEAMKLRARRGFRSRKIKLLEELKSVETRMNWLCFFDPEGEYKQLERQREEIICTLQKMCYSPASKPKA